MIFISGIAGFVMSNVANYLGEKCFGVDTLQFGYAKNLSQSVFWEKKSFSEIDTTRLNNFDVLIHGATTNLIYSASNCVETFNNNALETVKLFERFKGKIIYTSTCSVYNNANTFPTTEDAEIITTNSYDTSKYIVELYLKERGNYTTLRLSNVYGINQHPEHPQSGVIGKMVGAALKDEPIKIFGDGSATRDYTWIGDTVDAIIKAVELPALNTEINVASGIDTSSKDLAKLVWKVLNKPIKYTYETPRSIDTISKRQLDISKAKKLLDWLPQISLEEGIKKTIEWQLKQM